MGIIRAAINSIGGELADQWLETIEPRSMNNEILSTPGIRVRKNDKRDSNRKGTEDVISNGSIIHVPENTYMLLVDGGKIISATDEAGYYQVDNSRAPSIFFSSDLEKTLEGYNNTDNQSIERPGGLKHTLYDTWERFKFSGSTPQKQRVIYINKMEIPDIRFGTKNPLPYTDRVLVPGRVVPCKITSFGTYSIKISDPILFYNEVCDKQSKSEFKKDDMAEQYINEFLMAYQTALASLSMDQVLVSDIPIQSARLGKYMADTLDEEWQSKRGFFIHSVGIAGINYDEKTDDLLSKYGNDSILLDPNARAARVAGGLASGLEGAGTNEGGSMMGFAGIGMGMNAAGNLEGVLNPNQSAIKNPSTSSMASTSDSANNKGWTCTCGHKNADDAKFCSHCGNKRIQEGIWTCTCGEENKGKFCTECGKPKPSSMRYKCNNCGWIPDDPQNPPKFCPSCGDPFDITDRN